MKQNNTNKEQGWNTHLTESILDISTKPVKGSLI